MLSYIWPRFPTRIIAKTIVIRHTREGSISSWGRERLSRYAFAVKMAEAFKLPVKNILSSLRAEVKMAAARPGDVSLNSQKAYDLGYTPLSIEKELQTDQ